jgi:hypothetical protein
VDAAIVMDEIGFAVLAGRTIADLGRNVFVRADGGSWRRGRIPHRQRRRSAVRATVLGQPAATCVSQATAWAAGIVAVFASLGAWRYQRAS